MSRAMSCCVMQAYFRADTLPNKIAWGVFASALLMALVFTPLGASRTMSCAQKFQMCVDGVDGGYIGQQQQQQQLANAQDLCRPVLYKCHFFDWYQLFCWGIILFIVAGVVLCYFWCCAVPPGYTTSHATYAVTGTYQVGQPINAFETTPLFHYSATGSSTAQLYPPHYPGQMAPPPPYQFAQLYPTHTPGVQLHTFVPPTYTVTLGPTDSPSSLGGGYAPVYAAGIGHDPSFGGGVHPVSAATAAATHAAGEQGGMHAGGSGEGVEEHAAAEGKGHPPAGHDFSFHTPRSQQEDAAVTATAAAHAAAAPPVEAHPVVGQASPVQAPGRAPDLL